MIINASVILSIAAFKQQNAIHGLPLQLGPEEVTLALEKGWGAILPSYSMQEYASNHKQNIHHEISHKNQATTDQSHVKQRTSWDYSDDDDDSNHEHHTNDAGRRDQDTDDGNTISEHNRPAWQDALAHGSYFSTPATPYDAGNPPARQHDDSCHGEQWNFPSNKAELHRYIVFRDLHSRGFRITGGSKFGADFLLYPGDPTLYHAQFCVRIFSIRNEFVPALLAAACRGSFQARKHLLIASIDDSKDSDAGDVLTVAIENKSIIESSKVVYTTFGPVDGFG